MPPLAITSTCPNAHAGHNLGLINYLLLALAAFQFPLLLWLCHVQLPQLLTLIGPHFAGAGAKAAATSVGAAAGTLGAKLGAGL